jgi:glycosyltransferase involved in cell wall biosynthesis
VFKNLGPLTLYLRRGRPRALVASMSHANLVLWAGNLARRATLVVVTVPNTMSRSTSQQGRLAEWVWPCLLWTFYPWASAVVAVSQGAADDLARTAGLRRERVWVVYNPVITPTLLASARQAPDHPWFVGDGPPVILGVGRLTPQDFTTLITAFAGVRRHRNARLMILGAGENRSRLEALVSELGLAQDVALPAFRDNAAAYMARSALFVRSSAWEGMPTVLIEALAAGAAVVSTDCASGPREILQDGRLGRLVPVGDSVALTDAILDALGRPRTPPPPDALMPFTREAAGDHYLRLIESA